MDLSLLLNALQRPEANARLDIDLSSIRLILNGAEPVNAEVCENFQSSLSDYGLRSNVILPVYGLAEACVGVTSCFLGDTIKSIKIDRSQINIGDKINILNDNDISGMDLIDLGRATYICEVKITDENFCDLPQEHIGLILIKGDNVASGYYNAPVASAERFLSNGWLNSGDIGFFHNDRLYISGRYKDMIIINGHNYYTSDIESTLLDNLHIPNLTIAAFGTYNTSIGTEDIILAVLPVNQDFTDVAKKIIQASQIHLGIKIQQIIEVDEFPRTASGKVQHYMLKQKYESQALAITNFYGTGTPTCKINTTDRKKQNDDNDSIYQFVNNTIKDILKSNDIIDGNASFYELGLTSIDIEQLLARVEIQVGKSIDIAAIFNYPTVKGLVSYLSELSIDAVHNEEKTDGISSDIAIIGMACRFPGEADSVDVFWDNLMNNRDCIIPMSKKRCNLSGIRENEILDGGYIEDIASFDCKFFSISPQEAKKMDPQQRLLLETSYYALEDASLSLENIADSDMGVFIGMSSQEYFFTQGNESNNIDLHISTGNAMSIAANRISYIYNLHGPSITLDTACSSSLVAVHQAVNAIRSKQCKSAFVGGVNLILNPSITDAFRKAGMLSNDCRCKTFDERANGYVRGEGCGVVIIKDLQTAVQDNNKIYAVIKGSAINQDGKSNGLTSPNGSAQIEVMTKALSDAGISADKVNHVEAHGTGTKLGDPIEFNSLLDVYGKNRDPDNLCLVGSVKTNIGHLEAAAGIAGLIKTCCILHRQQIPTLLHYQKQNPYIRDSKNVVIANDINITRHAKRSINYAAISSFGFGGTNAHIVLEKPKKLYCVENDLKPKYAFDHSSEYWLNTSSPAEQPKEDIILYNTMLKLIERQNELLEEIALNSRQYNVNEIAVSRNQTQTRIESTELSANIYSVLSDITAYSIDQIRLEHQLMSDLGFDSIMIGALVTRLASIFPELSSQVPEITTKLFVPTICVGDIIAVLNQYLQPKPATYINRVESALGVHVPIGNFHNENIHKSIYDSDEFLAMDERIKSLEGFNPYFKINEGIAKNTIRINGKEMINYSNYNYVGLNGSPEIDDAVIQALKQYGSSVSGSRPISGEIELHLQLEKEIADFIGVEDSIVYIGGHSTNVSTIGHLMKKSDLILHDALSHNSIIQGCLLSGAKRVSFPHNDMESLKSILQDIRAQYRHVLIVVEGIYSMDGDLCPLPELIDIKKEFGALLMVDEAHSLGTIGECGRGVGSHFNINPNEVDLWMGTLSKSLCSCGGYIAGDKRMVDYLKYSSPGFLFSVGITPTNAASALTAIRILKQRPELMEQLSDNSALLRNLMKEAGLDTGFSKNTPIVPLIIGDSLKCAELSRKLYEHGINVMPIIYPAVAESEARLRFFVSAIHTESQIKETVEVLKKIT